MKFVRQFSFPFVEWLTASVLRVRWLIWASVIASALSFGDVLLEHQDGIAKARMGRTVSVATRNVMPNAYDDIIRFEILRSIGLLLLAYVVGGVVHRSDQTDILDPDRVIKSADDK